ncbi:MAG TPA: gamma-glutamyl-gamma-aminobutyrate hydrolase family protein [Woeseiaceae bacterium]|jgi:anthranilate/para-aminobenzoate synthase component II|nr:gamma-glutamyl-gamma-aminobutyrate hydrolase family protein [Woeseiaceae bacterium]
MKRILISQRRDAIPGRKEERDATDTRIGKILFELGFLPIFLCSDIVEHDRYLSALQPDGFLLGSGNDLGEFPQRDSLEESMLNYARLACLPVFAICRGAQMLNQFQGGTVRPVTGHVATRLRLVGPWAADLGYSEINSYHNFAITPETLGHDLRALASTADGVIKAIQHRTLPWLGIMWHPEREPELLRADARLITRVFDREI